MMYGMKQAGTLIGLLALSACAMTSKAPDLSVASLRVSETVSTATRSGLNGRASLVTAALPTTCS